MRGILAVRIFVFCMCLLAVRIVDIVPDLYAQQSDPSTLRLISRQASLRTSSSISLKINSGHRITFEHLSPGEGLLQNTITCILQDQKGFLWFGTEEGLIKYDGYGFTVYKNDSKNPNSLSHDVVQSIYEDHLGILWIGTRGGGLNCFDRATEQFFHYQSNSDDPKSLSHNNVFSIYEDQRGVIWIGTDGGGLNRLDRETDHFSHYRHDESDPRSLSSNFIRSIYEDRSEGVWVGTLGGGVNRFDRKTGEFDHYQYEPDNPHSLSHDAVWAIHEDSSGTLWIGTYGGGLNRFDRATGRFSRYQTDPNDPYSLSHNRIRCIYEDREKGLWIGTDGGGLNRFDRATERFFHYQTDPTAPSSLSHNIVRSIYEDQAGILWIGTEGGGIDKIMRGTEQFFHYQIDSIDSHNQVSNIILSIYEDQSGVLWIGTYGGGLNRYDREKKELTQYQADPNNPYSLSSDVVFSIYEDRSGVLWIGTRDGGLNRFDRATERFFSYQHDPNDSHSLSHNRVRTIYEDQRGTLWIGTEGGGLNKLVPSEDEGFDPQTSQGETEHFVHYQYDPNIPYSLSHNDVWTIYEDHLGELWIGTDGGLNKLDRATERFLYYQNDPTNPGSLSNNSIRSIYEDRSGILWIGTRGGGLNKFDRVNETFTHYDEKGGLPTEVIYGILEDPNGNLWLSTNKNGLSKFDPHTATYKNFDVKDGLQGNVFTAGAYYQSRWSGEMFFGGINGFNAFYPESIRGNPHIPPIVITDFQLFNKSVEIRDDSPLQKAITETEEIMLSYKDNVLSFEFAALDYTLPEENLYAYMLEGVEKDWVYSGTRRFVTYTHLDPGTYIFRVKGANNEGVWNDDGVSINITITPPFWETWRFRIVIAILIVGGVLGGFYVRVRTIHAQKRYLEIQVNKRTKDLKEANEQLRRDIAERKQMEIDLQHAKEAALEAKDAAEEARGAAESANRAKSEFLANMSHELRTPLNAILGYAQIFLRDESFTEKQREAVRIVQRSGEHLLSMITDILDLSKIEARKIPLEPTALYLPGFLKSLADMVQVQASHKGISFTSEIAPDIPEVIYADERRLRQILLNLLSNAVKFTKKGYVTFRVGYRDTEIGRWGDGEIGRREISPHLPISPSPHLRFEVEDTGPGISSEDLEKIFQPFQQVGENRLHAEGTGLGLAISQSLVRMMGSELSVKSTLGQGSIFWFDMEFPEVMEERGVLAEAKVRQRKIVGFKGNLWRILVADDSVANRAIIRDMLSPLGFEVIEAVDGLDALDKAKACHPDLILMDLLMSRIDGFEATRKIREEEQKLRRAEEQKTVSSIQYPVSSNKYPVIIGMSASVFLQTQKESIAAGCNDFIAKPVSLENLLALLQVHLKLEWIYEEKSDDPHVRTYSEENRRSDVQLPTSPEQHPIILPPIEQLEILYELIKMGDIATFRGQLKAIVALDQKFGPFVAKLNQLSKGFQMTKIRRCLEGYLKGEK
jgi:two-component system sensor histidine kinase ChiS